MQKYYDYFLGASSPGGFADFFRQLCDNDFPMRTYIIKSGPGCGKSTMMRRIGARIIKEGYSIEFIHCSSDPDSLDGVICPELEFAIVDGTAPHVLEPSIPAAKQEVVSLYDTIDKQALRCNFETLRDLFSANANLHERTSRFICAAGTLYADAERGAAQCILHDKLERYALALTKKLFTPVSDKPGRVSVRLSTAVTPKGIVSYARDNSANSRHVYLLDDKFGSASHLLLAKLRVAAGASGYEVADSRSPMSPYDKTEMLEIPALSLCFTLSSYFAPVQLDGAKKVNMLRFYDKNRLAQAKNRMRFSRKATLQLLDQASFLLSQAKQTHDQIEDIYKANIDFDIVREKEREILNELGLR